VFRPLRKRPDLPLALDAMLDVLAIFAVGLADERAVTRQDQADIESDSRSSVFI